MKITSPKLGKSHLTSNEMALRKCRMALDLRDKGDYQGAQNVMRPLWKQIGEQPDVMHLHDEIAAEVLLTVGILTSWIGSKEGVQKAQEIAKNLITEASDLFEKRSDGKMVAVSRAEIAYCYFREGALDEARIMLTESLERLTIAGNTKARALLKLITVEWSASRYDVALQLLTDNAPLFKRVTDNTIRGNYHNELGVVLRRFSESEPFKRAQLLEQALKEFKAADRHFHLAKNKVFGACVKNNVGLVLFNLRRFKDAYRYLQQARRLSVSAKNKIQTAVIDESRAQVLIGEARFKEAEAVARYAVQVLNRSDHEGYLADALTTHGVALARLGKKEQALFTLQRAIDIAQQVGAINKAGIAALTLIEEIADLPADVLEVAYDRASEWLATSQSQEVLQRVIAVSKRIRANPNAETKETDPLEALLSSKCDLNQEMLKHEREFIRQALAKAGGRVTRAASLLGMSYQGLAYIIENRHPELLKERSPIRRRSGKYSSDSP